MDKVDPPLTALLDEVYDRLRRGDLSDLPLLAAQMQEAEDSARQAGAAELLEIRRLAERNARTMVSARRGIKAARRRVNEVISAARGLVTYDARGQRVEENEGRTLAKRF